MNFLSCAWLWMYFGALLMLLEIVAPGFVIFFFGLSAMTVGMCRFAFGEAFGGTWQLAAFSGFVILYLALLRRWMKRLFTGTSEESKVDFNNETVGRIGKVTVVIAPPLAGRVMIGDAEWSAVSSAPVAVGADVRVVSQNNLTMTVEEIRN